MITEIVKGDTIILECDINADITDWEIRFELEDECGQCIRLATANVTGGSNDQIEVTSISSSESTFLIKVASGETDCFADKAKIEIEVTTTNTVNNAPEICTIFKGNVDFRRQIIEWEEV